LVNQYAISSSQDPIMLSISSEASSVYWSEVSLSLVEFGDYNDDDGVVEMGKEDDIDGVGVVEIFVQIRRFIGGFAPFCREANFVALPAPA